MEIFQCNLLNIPGPLRILVFMDQIIIRQATLQDMETLLRFEQGVIRAERPFDSTLKDDPLTYYDIEELIRAPHIELVVAVQAGEVIGSGYARIEKARHFVKHPVHAYLGFMYVDPAHRGKGVNQKIIAVLQDWAMARQVTEMQLEVYYDNAPAIRAYEKVGFIRHMIQMRKPVD